jgi:hypothetical protein
MTVLNVPNYISYQGDGGTSVFPFPYKFFESSNIHVYKLSGTTTVPVTTGYSLSYINPANGCNVVFTTPPASGTTVYIERELDEEQTVDLPTGGAFLESVIEGAGDYAVMLIQQLSHKIARALKMPVASGKVGIDFPLPSSNKVIGWDSLATYLENKIPTTITLGELAVIGDYGDSIETAVATIGATKKTVLINKAITLLAGTTVPSNIDFVPILGGMISGSGVSLHFDGAPFHPERFECISGVSISGLGLAYPEWWGAVRDGSTNDGPAIQTAIDCIMTGGGEVSLANGRYMVRTAGVSVINYGSKGFTLSGAGQYNTILLTPTTGEAGALASGDLLYWKCTGPATTVKDIMVTADTGGNFNINGLNISESNGVTARDLWFSSTYGGFKISESSSDIRVSNVVSELNTLNYWIHKSYPVTMTNYQSYRSSLAGVYVTGNTTDSTNKVSGSIILNGGAYTEDGYGGGGTGGALVVDSLIPVIVNGIEIANTGLQWPIRGIYVVSGNVHVSEPVITRCKSHGVQVDSGDLTINGGEIRKIGYFDQSSVSAWPCYGLYAAQTAGNIILNGTKINSEGAAVYTQAVNTELNGVLSTNCCGGGSSGMVNTVSGVSTFVFDPQAVARSFKMIGCSFYDDAGTSKNVLTIGADAIPTDGYIKLIGNNIIGGSVFTTPFASAMTSGQLLGYDYSDNRNFLRTESSGTSTVLNTATTSVITHGLGLTPLAEHISIIGKEAPSNAIGVPWISGISSTQFTVNIADPGASNWDFGWRVSIK